MAKCRDSIAFKRGGACIAVAMSTLVFMGACDQKSTPGPASDGPSVFRLVEQQRFGAPGIGTEFDSLPANGPVLARIDDIVQGPDSLTYVLDSDYKKIAVFGPDGALRRVILGGFGEGPGEFRFPKALDLVDGKDIVVYDYALRRVSYFHADGEFVRSFPVPVSAADLVVRSRELVFSRHGAKKRVVVAFDSVGKQVFESIDVVPKDRDYAPNGVISRLAQGRDQAILASHLRPGLWWHVSKDGTVQNRGTELFPSARMKRMPGDVDVRPATTRGIAQLNDGTVAILYSEADMTQAPYAESVWHVAFMRDAGTHVSSIALPFRWVSAFRSGSDGRSLLLAVVEPYPQVIWYSIDSTPNK